MGYQKKEFDGRSLRDQLEKNKFSRGFAVRIVFEGRYFEISQVGRCTRSLRSQSPGCFANTSNHVFRNYVSSVGIPSIVQFICSAAKSAAQPICDPSELRINWEQRDKPYSFFSAAQILSPSVQPLKSILLEVD
jgi:hypothetical protein